jgi:hypothetical protein
MVFGDGHSWDKVMKLISGRLGLSQILHNVGTGEET